VLYEIAVLVFAAVFFGTLAVYLVLRARLTKGSQPVVRRLDDITRGDVNRDDEPQTILKDQSLSRIPALHRLLSRLTWSERIQAMIRQAGMRINVGTFVLSILVLGIATLAVVHYISNSLVVSLAAGVAGGALPCLYVLYKRKRRIEQFDESLPEALDLIGNALKSGFTFEAALKMVGEEVRDPLGTEFALVFEEQNLGSGLTKAMANLLRRVPSHDLELFMIAIIVHKRTGGQLAEVLGHTATTIRQRFQLKKEIRTKTVHSRFSGIILIILPIAMIGAMLLLNPDYINILFATKTGNYLLAAAFIMQLLGIWIIKRIINIRF
jgi:tight adherence protein B